MNLAKYSLLVVALAFACEQSLSAEQPCIESAPAPISRLMPATERLVAGAAYADDRLDYCEWHSKIADGSQTVLYWQGEQVLALKRLTFDAKLTTPNVAQRDFRTGELRQVIVADDKLRLGYREGKRLDDWQAFSRELNMQAISNTETTSLAAAQVVDAGFDHFVRSQWQSLAAGNTLEFYFASPVHEKNLRLRARAEEGACAGSVALCVVVEPASGLLRLFAGELVLAYGADKRLLVFSGVTNIADESGESKAREIHYRYF